VSLIVALTWLVEVLSFGAVLLLMWPIRHKPTGKVASPFCLVPPFNAVETWLLFGECLSTIALGGIGLRVPGVAAVIYAPARARRAPEAMICIVWYESA